MSAPLLMAEDFGTYLNVEFDQQEMNRAQQILGMAQALCESVVSPLPAGAEAVILDVTTRAWSNPTNAQATSTGPYSVSYGAVSGGLWLTRQNRITLRRLAGGSGGAFTIEMISDVAAKDLPWWDMGSGLDTADTPWH